jgi:hypothetical protein
VLSADVRLEGFTATDWSRVLALFAPRKPSGGERDPDRPRGGVVAIHGEGRLRKLVHTQAGRMRLDDILPDWPVSPEELAKRHGASWGAVVEMGALENVMDRFGAKVRRGDDFTSQMLLLVSLARDELLSGRIQYWPARLTGMPVPTPGVIHGTLDAVCPGGSSILLGLFEAGELWTSIALRRSHAGTFDWILGPDEIRREMGLLAGDFRRDYRHLSRTIERKIGRISLGCFSEAATFKRLEVDPSPGAWAKAVAIRDVILSPVPPALAIPLGIDAGRAAVSALRTVVDRSGALDLLSPAASALRRFLPAEVLDELFDRTVGADRDGRTRSDLASVFGFEPLELLRRLLSRDD